MDRLAIDPFGLPESGQQFVNQQATKQRVNEQREIDDIGNGQSIGKLRACSVPVPSQQTTRPI